MDKECIQNLNKITDATGANIIISSNWREQFLPHENKPNDDFDVLVEYLQGQGVTGSIIGCTPVLDEEGNAIDNRPRGYQINLWLKEHGDMVENFVVLDDNTDIDPVRHRFVHCLSYNGITEELAEEAISLLNEE